MTKSFDGEVRLNFSRWANEVVCCNLCGVADLFHNKATFHPTFSDKLLIGKDGAKEYFSHFFKKDPTSCLTTENIVQELNPCAYLHTGKYIFVLGDGKRVLARFSFVWTKGNGGWEIIHFHSSIPGE